MPSTLVDPRSHGIAVNTEQVRSHRVGGGRFSVPATCCPGIERRLRSRRLRVQPHLQESRTTHGYCNSSRHGDIRITIGGLAAGRARELSHAAIPNHGDVVPCRLRRIRRRPVSGVIPRGRTRLPGHHRPAPAASRTRSVPDAAEHGSGHRESGAVLPHPGTAQQARRPHLLRDHDRPGRVPQHRRARDSDARAAEPDRGRPRGGDPRNHPGRTERHGLPGRTDDTRRRRDRPVRDPVPDPPGSPMDRRGRPDRIPVPRSGHDRRTLRGRDRPVPHHARVPVRTRTAPLAPDQGIPPRGLRRPRSCGRPPDPARLHQPRKPRQHPP